MAAIEKDLKLEDETQDEQKVPASRIKELSDKVKSASQERDTLAEEKRKSEEARAVAEKKAGFYKDFSKLSSKYNGAADHLDEIEAKVMAGYDPEDATVSVLNKAGKLSGSPQREREMVAGGSSATNIPDKTAKSLGEMSQAELRQAIIDTENESGAISKYLERKSLS